MSAIDPNQFIIYSPVTGKSSKKEKVNISSAKGITDAKTLSTNLEAMKGFYSEKNVFSSIKEGEHEAHKAGENLSRNMTTSIEGERKVTKEEKNLSELKDKKIDEKKENMPMKDDYSEAELAELRHKTKEDYGSGLVGTHHKGAKTVEEHEAAQLKAYEGLEEKIKSGAVKPDSIQSDMLNHFELRNKPEVNITNTDQISGHVSKELEELTGKEFIKKDEADLIKKEANKITDLYKEAFPEASPQEIFELVRDNARKLAYQSYRDKHVFGGSSHGTRHILTGNMNMADRMIEGLGNRATAKDKLLIHQIITDHDIGYTVGVIESKDSINATGDHPLFSAKFVEDNKDYYIKKFGHDGYETIKDGILMHSYPKSEYNTPVDMKKGFNPDLIRSITSTVDALGVTAETKCPAFFREPEAMKILQKIQLYSETHEGNIPPDIMAKYREEFKKVAEKESSEVRKRGFMEAIESRVDTFPYIVKSTLGQYTGVLKDITLTEKEGKIIPSIKMDISRSQALLGNIFGDKMSTQAFVKAMEDLGVPEEKMSHMGSLINQIKEAKTGEEKKELIKNLRFESDKAIFEFGSNFDETSPEVQKTFEELEKISIRQEIRGLANKLKSPENRTSANITALMDDFRTSISEEMNKEDVLNLMNIQKEFISSSDEANFDKAIKKLSSFTSRSERSFMGI
jgi:hypothetical protein